jgi:hypothetical protein
MKHLRKFEKYTTDRKKSEIIKESVLQVNDIYKVRTFVDIPQSLINSYVKKVKDTAGKNLRQFFGDVDIAEEIVKYINLNFLNVDKIPAEALMGGKDESQPATQPSETETETTEEPVESTETTEDPVAEAEPEIKVETEVETETPAEGNSDDFEEVKEEEKEESTEENEEKSKEEGTEELPS